MFFHLATASSLAGRSRARWISHHEPFDRGPTSRRLGKAPGGPNRPPSARHRRVLAPRDSACRLSDPATPGPNVGPRLERRRWQRRCDDETHPPEGHHLVDRRHPWCAWAPRLLGHSSWSEPVRVLARRSRARSSGGGDTRQGPLAVRVRGPRGGESARATLGSTRPPFASLHLGTVAWHLAIRTPVPSPARLGGRRRRPSWSVQVLGST